MLSMRCRRFGVDMKATTTKHGQSAAYWGNSRLTPTETSLQRTAQFMHVHNIKLHRDDNREWSLVFGQSYSCHAMSRSDLFFQHIRFRSGFHRSCLYCMQSLMFPKVCFRPIGPASTITQDPALARLVQALGFSVKAVFVMWSGSVWNVLNEHILHVFGSQICLPYTRCFSHCLSLKLVRVL